MEPSSPTAGKPKALDSSEYARLLTAHNSAKLHELLLLLLVALAALFRCCWLNYTTCKTVTSPIRSRCFAEAAEALEE